MRESITITPLVIVGGITWSAQGYRERMCGLIASVCDLRFLLVTVHTYRQAGHLLQPIGLNLGTAEDYLVFSVGLSERAGCNSTVLKLRGIGEILAYSFLDTSGDCDYVGYN